MRQFIALQTFESLETRSVYVEGLSYRIVDGNRLLGALAELWAIQGKVKFLHNPTAAVITGKGFSDPSIWLKTKMWFRSVWR